MITIHNIQTIKNSYLTNSKWIQDIRETETHYIITIMESVNRYTEVAIERKLPEDRTKFNLITSDGVVQHSIRWIADGQLFRFLLATLYNKWKSKQSGS